MISEDENARKKRRATGGTFAKNLDGPIAIKAPAPQKDVDAIEVRITKIEEFLRSKGFDFEASS